MNGEAGKGDRYRDVDMKKYGENYDRIFRKDQFPSAKQASDNLLNSLSKTGVSIDE